MARRRCCGRGARRAAGWPGSPCGRRCWSCCPRRCSGRCWRSAWSRLASRAPALAAVLDLRPRLAVSTWLVAAVAAAGCALAVAGPAARRGRAYAAELAARSRPRTRSVVLRAGLDVVLLALAVLSWLQLRQYASPLSARGFRWRPGHRSVAGRGADPRGGRRRGAHAAAAAAGGAPRRPPRGAADRQCRGVRQLAGRSAGRMRARWCWWRWRSPRARSRGAWPARPQRSAADQADLRAGADLRVVEEAGVAPGGPVRPGWPRCRGWRPRCPARGPSVSLGPGGATGIWSPWTRWPGRACCASATTSPAATRTACGARWPPPGPTPGDAPVPRRGVVIGGPGRHGRRPCSPIPPAGRRGCRSSRTPAGRFTLTPPAGGGGGWPGSSSRRPPRSPGPR